MVSGSAISTLQEQQSVFLMVHILLKGILEKPLLWLKVKDVLSPLNHTHGGLEALQNATTAGLPGFAVRYDRDGAGDINSVHIWAPNGDYYRSYHHLASLGINTATIRCPFWLQRRRLAVENHFFPDNGWATGPTRGSHFYAPNGDEFRGTLDAWITAGVVLPPRVVMRVVNDYRRIVKELSVRNSFHVMSTQAICDLVGGRVTVRTMVRFLESGNANFRTIYPI
eukprot:scaffold11985_cov72-Skeletonema_dohrnii-CCMP3373.AAC.1